MLKFDLFAAVSRFYRLGFYFFDTQAVAANTCDTPFVLVEIYDDFGSRDKFESSQICF